MAEDSIKLPLAQKLPKLEDSVSKEDYEKLIQGMLQDNNVKTLYEKYIRRDIPYEDWVRKMCSRMVVDKKGDKP